MMAPSHTSENPTGTAALAPRLRMATMRLARRLRQQAPEGSTPSQLSALSVVDRHGPLTLGRLAEAERVQPPTMTRIVAALEAAGLVQRAPAPSDRRVALIATTPTGRQLVEQNRSKKDAYLDARLSTFTERERGVLAEAAELLERLLEEEP